MREIHSFGYAPDLPVAHEIQNARKRECAKPAPLPTRQGIKYGAAKSPHIATRPTCEKKSYSGKIKPRAKLRN